MANHLIFDNKYVFATLHGSLPGLLEHYVIHCAVVNHKPGLKTVILTTIGHNKCYYI